MFFSYKYCFEENCFEENWVLFWIQVCSIGDPTISLAIVCLHFHCIMHLSRPVHIWLVVTVIMLGTIQIWAKSKKLDWIVCSRWCLIFYWVVRYAKFHWHSSLWSRALPKSFNWGGWIEVHQTHLPWHSNFSSDFGYFILKVLENLLMLACTQKKNIQKSGFLWGRPPEFQTGGCP